MKLETWKTVSGNDAKTIIGALARAKITAVATNGESIERIELELQDGPEVLGLKIQNSRYSNSMDIHISERPTYTEIVGKVLITGFAKINAHLKNNTMQESDSSVQESWATNEVLREVKHRLERFMKSLPEEARSLFEREMHSKNMLRFSIRSQEGVTTPVNVGSWKEKQYTFAQIMSVSSIEDEEATTNKDDSLSLNSTTSDDLPF